MLIIDPPVGPYHTRDEIQAWIDKLRGMNPSPEVSIEIARAEHWIALKDANEGAGEQ